MEDKKDELKCPECGSGGIYTKVRDKTRVCKKCGHEWNIKVIN